MKSKKSYLVIALTLSVIIFQACHKGKKVTNISAKGSSKSHNIGKNCMTCHTSGGEGAEAGWFQTAGTVYDSVQNTINPNATVYLYTGPNGTGTLKHTIQVDDLGNFYTTEAIDFGSGLYPAVQGNTQTKYMFSTITTGQCNSCHGSTTGKIWTK